VTAREIETGEVRRDAIVSGFMQLNSRISDKLLTVKKIERKMASDCWANGSPGIFFIFFYLIVQ